MIVIYVGAIYEYEVNIINRNYEGIEVIITYDG